MLRLRLELEYEDRLDEELLRDEYDEEEREPPRFGG